MITAETNKSLPLCEISTIIIETTLASITSALIIKAMENGIAILFCNDRHQIQSEVVSLTSHHSQSGNVHIQCKWQSKTKDKLWASIIKEKISMQKQVLLQATGTCPQIMSKYYKNVTDGDATNREGQAARIHFNTLFGIDFIRHEDDQNNAMLNYGYAILHSRVSQAVILCGYITNIGIKHIGKTNPFNLSYDLIEPFRPLVDAIVYRHRSEVLNQECKKDLINVLYQKISYGGRIFSVGDVIELFVRDCLNSMKKEEMLLKKMKIVATQ